MLLKQQYNPSIVSKESEAFCATCVVFKIKLNEIAMASGLPKTTIEKFKTGNEDLTSIDLFKIVKVLTPNERVFYNAMLDIQQAAEDARLNLPLLDFTPGIHEDVYRDALGLTMQTFNIQHRDVYTPIGMQSSNFSAWWKGSRGISVNNLNKIKSALSREQRTFMEAAANVFICLEPQPPTTSRPVAVGGHQVAA
jgi:hypothetical protein